METVITSFCFDRMHCVRVRVRIYIYSLYVVTIIITKQRRVLAIASATGYGNNAASKRRQNISC